MVTREYPPFIVGGVGTHTYYLTKYLKRKGVKVKVISFGDPKLSNEEVVFIKPNSSIISRKSANIVEDLKVPFDILGFIDKVRSVLRSGEYDIVHIQEPYIAGILSYEYKVTTIHDTSFGEIKSYLKYPVGASLKRMLFYVAMGYAMEFSSILTSKIVITPSIDVVWELIRVYKAPLRKIRLIPNGIEEPPHDEPDKALSRQILDIPEDCFVVSTTAQHVARKRLDILIRATKVLKEKSFKNFMVIIGGSGPLTGYLKTLTKELGVGDVIKFVGWLPDNKLPLYYNVADVFVITSEYEAGPLTMLEAGIRGIPLIVSDVPSGFMMLARDGLNCLKFKPEDPTDLAYKIITIANDYSLRKKLSKGAKAFASLFKWDKIAEKTIKVYTEVLYNNII